MSIPKKTKPKPWYPKLFPKQMEVFNCYKKFTLLSGPRYTGKSIAACHRVIRHMYEVPGAYVGVFSKTIRVAKEGGIWLDFLNIILPEWLGREIDADGNEKYVPKLYNRLGQPFEYTTFDSKGTAGPKSDSTTRTMYFKIRNYWGGESKLLLFSLDNEAEAEARLKSTRFSCIYVPEIANFKTNKIYSVAINQLRMYHLKEEQHMWIADTNPDEDGTDSWLYKLFYEERVAPNHKFPSVQKDLHLIEIFLHDNPTLTPGRKAEIEQTHSDDEGNYQRNVNGLWVKGHGKVGKVFGDLFEERIHVIPDYIDINIGISDFFGGFDIGDVNSAAVMLERRIITRNGKEESVWMVFDEVAEIDSKISTEDFTLKFMDRLHETEAFYGKKIIFEKFWSDDDAVNKYRGTSDTYDYLVVRDASGGEIELTGVSKPSGSIGARVRLLRKLLQDNRIFIGSNCVHTIEMFKKIMKGEKDPISKGSRQKHIFDCLTYPIFMESLKEMDLSGQPKSRGDMLISV